MRVADYIAESIARLGVRHVFMITGGGAMHLDDAIGQCADLKAVFDHHEQACAIAAEGYARTTGGIGAVCVTTGPGGTNTITGVLGQWHDSIPALYVSGQVRLDTTVASTALPLRQLGDQEADIVRLVAPITKYAVSIADPSTVRYHFEKATWLATHGLAGRVKFLGELSPQELETWYARASVIVSPVLRREPFGLVGLEAMAHGKPMIAFEGGATNEWLVAGETGFLVAERSTAALAAALTQMLQSPTEARRMGGQARRRWENYRPEIYVTRLVASLERCIADFRRGRA